MKITWLGHSCFKIEAENYTAITDPFEDGYVPGFDNIKENANAVLCSHFHNDHGAKECVTIIPSESKVKIQTIDTYHDDKKGALRGENTIHIIDDGNIRLAHFGDLGCMIEKEQIDLLKNIDVALIPIGGTYTIDANEAKKLADAISARIVIPMHYKSDSFGFDVLLPIESYTSLCDDAVFYDTNSIEIDQNTPKQTALLKYIGKNI